MKRLLLKTTSSFVSANNSMPLQTQLVSQVFPSCTLFIHSIYISPIAIVADLRLDNITVPSDLAIVRHVPYNLTIEVELSHLSGAELNSMENLLDVSVILAEEDCANPSTQECRQFSERSAVDVVRSVNSFPMFDHSKENLTVSVDLVITTDECANVQYLCVRVSNGTGYIESNLTDNIKCFYAREYIVCRPRKPCLICGISFYISSLMPFVQLILPFTAVNLTITQIQLEENSLLVRGSSRMLEFFIHVEVHGVYDIVTVSGNRSNHQVPVYFTMSFHLDWEFSLFNSL